MSGKLAETNPGKNPALADRLGQMYRAKTNSNRANTAVVFGSGEFKPFVGYAETDLKKMFSFTLEINRETAAAIQERVITPLREIAQKHGITAIFAGDGDMPSHITLHLQRFGNIPDDIREKAVAWLNSDRSHLQILAEAFKGAVFSLSTLVIAPNSYLAAEFDTTQAINFRARKIFEKAMQHSLQRVDPSIDLGTISSYHASYDDIFHSSVARLTAGASPEALAQFAEEAERVIAPGLQTDPIRVVVDKVFIGTTLDFTRANAPHLIK